MARRFISWLQSWFIVLPDPKGPKFSAICLAHWRAHGMDA